MGVYLQNRWRTVLHPGIIAASNICLIPNLKLNQFILNGQAAIRDFGRAIQDPWEPMDGFYNRFCLVLAQTAGSIFYLAMQVVKAVVFPLTLMGLSFRYMAPYFEPLPPNYEHWITPQEQLLRVSNESTRFVDEHIAAPLGFSRASGHFPIASLMAEYLNPVDLEPHVRRCFEVLRMFNALPERIPPLPSNMIEFLHRRCMGCEELKQPDGNYYTLGDLFIPMLIPKELGTPDQFQERLLAYAQREGKPLGEFNIYHHRLGDKVKEKWGAIPFEDSKWILIAKELLPGPVNLEQSAIKEKIRSFSDKDQLSFEIPSWHDTVAAFYLYKVMTGKELFRKEGRQTAILVAEKLDSEPLGMGIGNGKNLNGSKFSHFRLWGYETGAAAVARL